ncbi:nickel transporter permease [Clostridium sp. 1001271B_151109_B4]|uniref:nickel transporter permease n=1 Tax=Clostridium sp. 1001271B_151109_B4 TaxID=2787148 RepID=UPI0018AB0277|nr:nickel transporter permease [Clostridium sp. 1001271B_151109_B4]
MSKKKKTKIKLIIFASICALICLIALISEYIVPYDPYAQNLSEALQSPSLAHILGTDRYGRDVFSRVIVGGRSSIFSTLTLILIITTIGTSVGLYCGVYGGIRDSILMRIADMFLAFPGMVFAIAVASVLGGGMQSAVIALAVISWPKYARIARTQAITLKTQSFIDAARLNGLNNIKIIFKHILPNTMGTIIVMAAVDIGTMMMELAALSFLGLGAIAPAAEWGSMMNDGRSMIQTSPWMILAPGLAIFITIMCFNLLGDTIRDYIDIK